MTTNYIEMLRSPEHDQAYIYYVEYFDGTILYEGDYVNDDYEGYGRLNLKDAGYYIGQFKSGKRNGKGKFYYLKGGSYEGDYVNGQEEGFGIYYTGNGGYYIGQFKDGLFEGKGTLVN